MFTYNIILVSGVYPSDQTLYNILCDHPDKSRTHLTPDIVIRILLTIFPMLYFTFSGVILNVMNELGL